MNESWGRLKTETSRAYEAFLRYLNLSPRVRSIDRAYRAYANISEDQGRVEAPKYWEQWSSKYHWVKRATAYDDYIAAQDLEKWEKRREQARERDWDQADRLRNIVDGALPSAEQFFRRQTTTIPGTPAIMGPDGTLIRAGTPAQTIITLAFQVTDLARVLTDASKLQRLANNEPTDNINNLTGAALDNALKRALEQLALDAVHNGDEAGDVEGSPDETAEPNPQEEADEGTED